MSRAIVRSRLALQLSLIGLVAIVGAAFAATSAQAAFTTGKCAGDDITGRGASFARDAHNVFNFNFRNIFCSGTAGAGTINVTYEAQGSGAGRLSMKVRDQPPRFGMSDEPPTALEVQQMNTGVGTADPATDANPNDNGQIHVIPAAVGAVAPIVNFPDGCDVTLLPEASRTAAQDRDNDTVDDDVVRVRFSKAQWEGIWSAASGFSQWDQVFAELAADSDCDKDIVRVVRFDESGTSFAFKDYLNEINGATGWLSAYGSGTNGTREWPGATFGTRTDCTGSPNGPGGGATQDTDRLTSGCSNGNGALVNKVIATDGSVGYSDISTARTAGLAVTPEANDNDVYWTQLPNGLDEFAEPTADPFGFRTDGFKGSNCLNATFRNVPASTTGDWSQVSGVDSDAGYGICSLTYGLVFEDNSDVWGSDAAEESKARTVKDYWDSIVTDGAQSQLFANDYAALPSEILTIARAGVGRIDWEGGDDDNPPPPPPPPAECGPEHPELCPDEPPPPVSNTFSIEKKEISSKRGSVTVTVRLPGAGLLELEGTGKKPKVDVGEVSVGASGAGTIKAKLKPGSEAMRVLKKKGKLRTKLTLTFSPTGGDPATQTTSVTLKKK